MAREYWVDRKAYPFRPHYAALEPGKVHYLDEGTGPCIVLVHGLPAWSFLFRHIVRKLRKEFRCVAPDLLGFGLSDKPPDGPYTAPGQAALFEAFIETLDLDAFTLVAHDWGGPIALSYALEHPDRIQGLVLSNTWMWSMPDDEAAQHYTRMFGAGFYKTLVRRFNRAVQAYGCAEGSAEADAGTIHKQYLHPLRNPKNRRGVTSLAGELLAAGGWLDGLWARRELLEAIPALLLWGMRDPLLGEAALARWSQVFRQVRVQRYPDAGHFPFEDCEAGMAHLIAEHVRFSTVHRGQASTAAASAARQAQRGAQSPPNG